MHLTVAMLVSAFWQEHPRMTYGRQFPDVRWTYSFNYEVWSRQSDTATRRAPVLSLPNANRLDALSDARS